MFNNVDTSLGNLFSATKHISFLLIDKHDGSVQEIFFTKNEQNK